jgi:hypothetical protein
VFASVLGIVAIGAVAMSPGPATAAKSKMGCEIGSEVWNATAGKCEPGTPKYSKRASTEDKAPTAPKKAAKAAKKKAPAK